MNEISTLITATTGLIAATGGLLISYLTLKHSFRKDRHVLKIEIGQGLIGQPKLGSTEYEWSDNMLTFNIANLGLKDFTITQIGLRIGKRSGGLVIPQPLGSAPLPYVLKPDSTCDFWTEYKAIEKKVKKMVPKYRLYNKVSVRAYAKDYIGNVINSNKMKIVLKETKFDELLANVRKRARETFKMFRP